MTGITSGATALISSPPLRDSFVSRTRRAHGCFTIGGTSATVHSTRRDGQALSVTVTVGASALQLVGAMTPTQARTMAKALTAAASAVERQGGAR